MSCKIREKGVAIFLRVVAVFLLGLSLAGNIAAGAAPPQESTLTVSVAAISEKIKVLACAIDELDIEAASRVELDALLRSLYQEINGLILNVGDIAKLVQNEFVYQEKIEQQEAASQVFSQQHAENLTQIKEQRVEIRRLESRLDEKAAQLNQSQEEIAYLAKTSEGTQAQAGELSRERARLLERIAGYEELINSLDQAAVARAEEISQLTSQIESLAAGQRQLQAAKAQLQEKMADYGQLVFSLNTEMKRVKDELSHEASRAEEGESKAVLLLAQKQDLENILSVGQGEVKRLEAELEELKSQALTLAKEKTKLSQTLDKLEQTRAAAELACQENKALRENLAAASLVRQGLKSKVNTLTDERDKLFSAHLQRQEDITASGLKISQLQQEKDAVQAQLVWYQEEVGRLKTRIDSWAEGLPPQEEASSPNLGSGAFLPQDDQLVVASWPEELAFAGGLEPNQEKFKPPLSFLAKNGRWKYLLIGLLLLPGTLILKRWLYF